MEDSSESSEHTPNNEEQSKESPQEDSKDLEARVHDIDSESNDSPKLTYSAKASKDSQYSSKKESHKKNKTQKSNQQATSFSSSIGNLSYSESIQRSNDGSAVLVEYVDTATGKVEFLFEEKPSDYAIKSERGKFQIMGGGIDVVDGKQEDSLDCIIREIHEEVEDPHAAHILVEKLLSQKGVYDVITEYVDGQPAFTYVYKVRITSPFEWHVIKNSRSSDNSGPLRSISLEDFKDKKVKRENFAFTHGDFMFDYVSKNCGIKAGKSHLHSGHLAHSLPMPSIPFARTLTYATLN